MVVPVSASGAGPEGVLEAAVEAFDEAVGLGMVGGGWAVLDVQLVAEARPKGRGELGASV